MLSDRQLALLVFEINREMIDIPFLSEKKEQLLIEKYANEINPHVGPAMEAVIGEVHVNVLKAALDEELSKRERQRSVSTMVKDHISAPLVTEINAEMDLSKILPESMEAVVLKVAIDTIIKLFTKLTLGEIKEQLDELEEEKEQAEQGGNGDGNVSYGPKDDSNADDDDDDYEIPEGNDKLKLEEGLLFSEKQMSAIVDEMNKDVNMPLLNEEMEANILERYVQKLNPHLNLAIEVVCGDVYAKAIRIALEEETSKRNRRKRISKLLQDELSEPLTTELNEKVDFYNSIFLSDDAEENVEQAVLKVVVNTMIVQTVRWIVSEIDVKINDAEEDE
mmetsp:Transcript_38175/g.43018  ORF Transcript_38175/g.43018 Transcript_38175/m.43018 type:complete len:335 (+) Transcript_38175:125-1129(+)